jgi:hypothetical protein
MTNTKFLELIDLAVERVENELSLLDMNIRGTSQYYKAIDSLKADPVHCRQVGPDRPSDQASRRLPGDSPVLVSISSRES